MSKLVSSADITRLDFAVLLNLSTAVPTVTFTNMSTVVNAANLKWVFEFYSPSGTPVYVGNFTSPDVNGTAFTSFAVTSPIPMIFGQVEFSNSAAYSAKVSVKDNAGIIYDLTKEQSLCKPNGNKGNNNFGAAVIDVEVKCATAQLLVTDKSNLLYKSLTGTKVSTILELDYPTDANGNKPTGLSVTSIPALLPIFFDASGYEVYVAHVYDYDLGDYFKVRLRYTFVSNFAVSCNVNLQPLLREVSKIATVLTKTCTDSADTREKYQKLNLATVYLLEAAIGIIQPLASNCVDIPKRVQEIKDILNVDCDCTIPSGLHNIGTALFTDAVVSVNKVCGDMLLSWANDGNGNIVLNYQNISYTFIMSAASGNSAAFHWSQLTSGCNKENSLFVDMDVLASEVLSAITKNQTLVDLLNDLITKNQLICSGLDGRGILNLGTCDYTVAVNAKKSGTALIGISVGGSSIAAPSGLLLTNAAGIQTWLNTIGFGTFTVVYSSVSKTTTITSNGNGNALAFVTSRAGTVDVITVTYFSSNCGMICTILQNIINYLADINMLQVKIGGEGLVVCSVDLDGSIILHDYSPDTSASVILAAISEGLCTTINYLKGKTLSCNNLKALFAPFVGDDDISRNNPAAEDIVPMFVRGKCQQMPVKNLAMSVFNMLLTDGDVKNIFCQMTPCDSVNGCTSVGSLSVSTSDTTAYITWSPVAGAIRYKWSLDGTTWNNVTSTAAQVTGLAADTAYVFRIYPVYASGEGLDCLVTLNFGTSDTGGSCAAPSGLALSTFTANSFRASWASVSGASGYQYRLNGGSWINLGTALFVDVTGLAVDTSYNFEVRAIVGGVPCPATSAATGVTDSVSDNVFIGNSSEASVVSTSLFGGSWFDLHSGTFPLTSGNLTGAHGAIAGPINLNIAAGTFTANASLVVGGVFIQCITLTPGSSNNFSTRSYTADQVIEIVLTNGSCD